MSTSKHTITVNGLKVEVVRKTIKNLHLAVYPPDGRVRVAVPKHISDDNVRLAVISKLPWIKRHQAAFLGQPRQSEREYVSGESHYFRGKRFRLSVIEQPGLQFVELKNRTTINLYVHAGSGKLVRQRIMTEWYRKQLKECIPELIDKWQASTGIEIDDWRVKRMKTKWGSCNASSRRIWLNLELAKKPLHCLEYVIVHEMSHLLEGKHNDAFIDHLDRFMPQWQSYRDELNQFVL
ncbi:SprT family zinc-dependent metalloprotease [Pontiellaceae bacterium B12227]|nr:SprT family zinc-dependent metalloprotease [Pontiellaceae bacterium B12227]